MAPETVKSVTTITRLTRQHVFSHVSHSDGKMYSKCINTTSVNGDSMWFEKWSWKLLTYSSKVTCFSTTHECTYICTMYCTYNLYPTMNTRISHSVCTRTYLSLCTYVQEHISHSVHMYKDIFLTLYKCTRTYFSLCTYVQGRISHSVHMYKDVSLTLYICTRTYLSLCTYVQGHISHSVHMYKDVSLTLYICTRTHLSLCTYVQGHISHSVCSDVYHYLSVLEASGVRSCLVPITASISWTLIYQTNTEYT